jgi:hypothetical protein
MSFDLCVFEKTYTPKTYEEFMNWYSEKTTWSEQRDYSTLEGTKDHISSWFLEMNKTFPAMNGPYRPSDEIAFATEDSERHLTDYSIGSDMIYGAFAWSLAEEASTLAAQLAKKHDVGFFNPQTGEIDCEGMVLCKIRNEMQIDEHSALWKNIESEILSLDNIERNKNSGNSNFLVVSFWDNGSSAEFMQCAPNYIKPKGFLRNIFKSTEADTPQVSSYTIEAGTGEKIYETQVDTKEDVLKIFHEYYSSRKLPDLTIWKDTEIL